MGEIAARLGRVLYEDVKPHEAPSSLADLWGPATGTMDLPLTVYWGPSRVFDLAHPGDVRSAYQAVIIEGRVVDQVRLLNAAILVQAWPRLMFPPRVRALWEGRFPELATAR